MWRPLIKTCAFPILKGWYTEARTVGSACNSWSLCGLYQAISVGLHILLYLHRSVGANQHSLITMKATPDTTLQLPYSYVQMNNQLVQTLSILVLTYSTCTAWSTQPVVESEKHERNQITSGRNKNWTPSLNLYREAIPQSIRIRWQFNPVENHLGHRCLPNFISVICRGKMWIF